MIYIPWSSDFALYLEDYLMYEHHTLGLWVSMISMTYISQSSDFAIYLEDYFMYVHYNLGYESV